MPASALPRGIRMGCAFCVLAAAARGQAPAASHFDVVGIVGLNRLFRFEDRSFGSRPLLGGGVGYTHRSGLGFLVEFTASSGFQVRQVPCAVSVPCVGTGREGVRSSSVAALNVLYHFSKERVQPYVTGGFGAFRSSGVSTMIVAGPTQAILSEQDWRDTGLGINFGAGLRVYMNRKVSLSPEFRLYNATAHSMQNLSAVRFSLNLGWHW